MKKIGILGGTFNPIHYGHLIFAENACDQYTLDEFWFLPNAQPPHKQGQTILPAEHRVNMIRAAIDGNPKFTLSDWELKQEGLSYTARTMTCLTEEYPDTEFYFLVGEDSLFEIETWVKPEVILSHCRLLVAKRDSRKYGNIITQARYIEEKYHTKVDFVAFPEVNISSSQIRERQAAGMTIRYLLPEAVREYIEQYHLYEETGLPDGSF